MPAGPRMSKSKRTLSAKVRSVPAGEITKVEARSFSNKMREGANNFIEKTPHLKAFSRETEATGVVALKKLVLAFSKATQKSHFNAIAFAFAFWVRSANNESYKAIIEQWRSSRQKKDKRTTDLHLIVENCIVYGENSVEERRLKRGLYNRDVRAILYAADNGIAPDQFEDKVQDYGEGLRKWSTPIKHPKKLSLGEMILRTAKPPKKILFKGFVEVVISVRNGGEKVREFKFELTDSEELQNKIENVVESFSDIERRDTIRRTPPGFSIHAIKRGPD